ncbi:hypothetical protein RvY_01916 [Ramazzottius varieornatus]|uniref:Secreted protein n=1 Tax=Ramazzottius varieornatus TaxID=947166 RepID=A0A1D1UI20_RAMVA|nr:hypothetical protein RvY_01916 [Ramazzottius varieornatus]
MHGLASGANHFGRLFVVMLRLLGTYWLPTGVVRARDNPECPTAIHLWQLDGSRPIESSLPGEATRRWNVIGHGRPIRVNITKFQMGATVQRGIFKKYCPVTPRLKIVDNRCK